MARSLGVMKELGLQHVEFCGAWGLSAGHHDADQTDEVVRLISASGMPVSCVSPRSFYMLPLLSIEAADGAYQADMAEFRAAVVLAKRLVTRLVRALPFQRPPMIFGANGAERALANQNRAWPRFLKLMGPIVELAEAEGVIVAVETGSETMASSCRLAARMVRDMGSPALRVMLDTGNNLYSTEVPYPEAYEAIREVLVHIQVKDARVDLREGRMEICPLGQGDLGDYLRPLADALRADGYAGVVSLENAYRQEGLTAEESFRQSVDVSKDVFGA